MRCFHRVYYSRYYLIGACTSLSNFTKWDGINNFLQLLNSPYKIYDIIILQANFLFRNIFFKINYKKIIVESIISLSLSWICWKRYVKIKHQKRTEKKLRVYKSLFIFSQPVNLKMRAISLWNDFCSIFRPCFQIIVKNVSFGDHPFW